MRFKKGNKVEVLRQKSSGAWYSAEILSCNGHTYSVQYDYTSLINDEVVVERISRKFIRPCPPLESLSVLVAGDLTEAFTFGAWNIAVLLKVLSGGCYLVRLVGSLEEFRVHKSNIRVRQSWQNDKWFVTGKMDPRIPYIDVRSKLQEGFGFSFQGKTDLEVSNLGASRTLKRALSSCSSHIGTYPRKMRRAEKDGRHEQVLSGSSFPLSDKVDAGDLLQENLSIKYLNFSFNNETAVCCETEKGDTYGGISCFRKRRRKAIDYDSDICSVGSCSLDNNSSDPRLHVHISAGTDIDADALYSKEESSHGCGDEEESSYAPSNRDEKEKIHRLELHAYRSTLAALHASGPLSWEQEALLTNLRMSLHISHDEYWVELRNLISSQP